MNEKMILINAAIALFYGTYVLFIKKLTFFRLNRFLLLSIPLIALLLSSVKVDRIQQFSSTIILPTVNAANQLTVFNQYQQSFHLIETMQILYLVVSALLFSFLILRFFKLFRVLASSERQYERDFYVSVSEGSYASFSFFNYLFINKADLSNKLDILRHEELHRKNLHSLDNVYFELVKCLFWFNPIVYIMHKELRKLHEYEVDEILVSTHSKSDYIKTLALSTPITTELILTNPYKSNSNLLNRLRMMKKNKSPNRKLMNYFVFIPALIIALAIIACSDSSTNEPNEIQVEEQSEVISSEKMKELTTQAQFVGGNQAMYDYLGKNIKYPKEAEEEGLAGKVIVSFIVGASGKIRNAKVEKGIHPLLDTEALRAVSEMPDWEPADMNGKKVAVSMLMPIQFQFAEDDM